MDDKGQSFLHVHHVELNMIYPGDLVVFEESVIKLSPWIYMNHEPLEEVMVLPPFRLATSSTFMFVISIVEPSDEQDPWSWFYVLASTGQLGWIDMFHDEFRKIIT
jgi:hypothetical protein